MRIDYFRIPDIAKRTGIPIEKVSEYTKIFDDFLTYAQDGETKLYTPDVLLIMTRIEAHFESGKTTDEVKEALNKEFPQLLKQKKMAIKDVSCNDEGE